MDWLCSSKAHWIRLVRLMYQMCNTIRGQIWLGRSLGAMLPAWCPHYAVSLHVAVRRINKASCLLGLLDNLSTAMRREWPQLQINLQPRNVELVRWWCEETTCCARGQKGIFASRCWKVCVAWQRHKRDTETRVDIWYVRGQGVLWERGKLD